MIEHKGKPRRTNFAGVRRETAIATTLLQIRNNFGSRRNDRLRIKILHTYLKHEHRCVSTTLNAFSRKRIDVIVTLF